MKNNKNAISVIALILVIVLLLIAPILLTGCESAGSETTDDRGLGIVRLPNGDIVEGEVESFYRSSDSGVVWITIDGKEYTTHSSNVVRIEEKSK